MTDQWRESNRLIRVLGGRWTPDVLAELVEGAAATKTSTTHWKRTPTRSSLTLCVLTDTLRRAERDGLISRHLDSERVETRTLYELTDLARSLDKPLATFDRWIKNNWQRVELARAQRDQRTGNG